ncbi:phosphoribosylanthranilate isomerase [Halovenus rubra]|uniref:Phosphoribosylanthranilate isomerase n=2 Tax=Halovenus rubra TaxID=869890 RepID=A0ACC7DZR3_9EURY|nr:phosphoribosylanthranilate isomerase [Halovenus rubra]
MTAGERTRVKICGLTNGSDRDAAIRAGADALGFIVDVPVDTPRELSPEQAATLVSGAPPLANTVLVTMPESVTDAVALHERIGADTLQIHGGLTPAELAQLTDRVDAAVIGVVDVHDEDVMAVTDVVDAVLVDSTDADGAGGTGDTHDWERTRQLVDRAETPVLLAGGLTPENVGRAVKTVEPFAVDTATGVERTDGHKSHDAIATFVRRATRPEVSA